MYLSYDTHTFRYIVIVVKTLIVLEFYACVLLHHINNFIRLKVDPVRIVWSINAVEKRT